MTPPAKPKPTSRSAAKPKAKPAATHTPEPAPHDYVEWNTPQGKTRGTVTRVLTHDATAGGHTAKATPEAPQYEVRSEKSGRKAIHKADALKKTD